MVAAKHRISVDLTPGDYETLGKLAQLKGRSKSAIIRDALALERWFQETKKEGGHVLVERDGETHEVVRP